MTLLSKDAVRIYEEVLKLAQQDSTTSNHTLRGKLDLSVARYDAAKDELLNCSLIKIGRGGGGGVPKIDNEVERLRQANPKATAILEILPGDGTAVGNISVRREIGLADDEDLYWAARKLLILAGQVRPKQGGTGGSLLRTGNVRLTTDEEVLFGEVPEDGTPVGNITLRNKLGWSKERYFRIRDRLNERGLIAVGRGKGGSVYRPQSVINPRENTQPEPTEEQFGWNSERDLYQPLTEGLEEWADTEGYDGNVIQITADQGRRWTGGKWTRPDLTMTTFSTYQYLPGKSLEVTTIEVKRQRNNGDGSYAWDIDGVFEALAHTNFAHRSYLVVHRDDDMDPDAYFWNRLESECQRVNVGLVLFDDPGDFDTFEILFEPEKRQPDPELVNQFIEAQLSDETKNQILQWVSE